MKRRHDLVDKQDPLGLQNEIGRTFGVDPEGEQLAQSRLQQIRDKALKRNKVAS